jgi:cysteine-rich repeat protein
MKLAPASLSFLLLFAPTWASAGPCDAALFGDGTCDCGCGSVDPDCPQGTFTVCQRSHCAAGQVPWEHSPADCMASACGDGWNDPARGEACDDGNAIASGGCSAGCNTVSAGYSCGERAEGCRLAPTDAGTGAQDAGTAGGTGADAGTAPPSNTGNGCAAGGSAGMAWAALGWMFGRRSTRRR